MDGRELSLLGGGVNQAGGRAYNERLALSLIRLNGPLPKAVLARLTGLSAQTLSQIIRRLEADGLVVAQEPLRGRIGQPSVPFALNPRGALSFGVKIGRRSCDIVLCDFVGVILARDKLTYSYPEPECVLGFVRACIERQRAEQGQGTPVAGVGVAMPFELWKWAEEVEVSPETLEPWRSLDVAAAIEAATGLPTLLANDATASCGAELAHSFRGAEIDLLYIFIGSFAGGGVVLNGRLVQGRTGNAGAIGSLPVRLGDRTTQLIHHASLITLEKSAIAVGCDPTLLQNPDANWDGLGEVLDGWVTEAADALALAAVSGACVIDFGHVCIDGAMPRPVLDRVVTATRAALDRVDRQGLSPFSLHAGRLGADARALGGAMLPILWQYGTGQGVEFRNVAAT